MIFNSDSDPAPKNVLITIVLISFFGFMIFYTLCLWAGKCHLEIDATITEFGVCLDTNYQPVTIVPVDIEQIYVCGKVEGTTPRPGVLSMFYKDKVVRLNTDFDVDVGFFHVPTSPRNGFEVGEYKIKIGYARKVIAETTFEVVP